ncbi:hypothetical protein FA13DRAFT_849283 [Coprinellus micaceus]|uniref:Uncharacterized protein n=1 Tax=Coprinellus micaceus TaxID=71717 RepID=A0A4Y7S1M5_COPMI|nr:hypothetical protein FA13DRAFT_849283 [Coprinellus micaceus]
MLAAASSPLLGFGAQVPFHATADRASTTAARVPEERWNFEIAPSPNATGNYIFESVSSLLQQWSNTRYRNGHNIVPVTIPVNTLLYHGTWHNEIPSVPDWVATDPEHSYLFCRGSEAEKGCWHLTLAVTRPLNVLYFDGSSAAKMEGCMDGQDMITWGNSPPNRIFDEATRIRDLCAWGKKYNLNGFMRMEMDFEIMLCDFTEGVEVASFLKLVAPHIRNRPPPPRKNLTELENDDEGMLSFRVLESGHTHNRFPGETRAQLDLTRLVSFYDIDMFPGLVESRYNQERFFHRPASIEEDGRKRLLQRLDEVLTTPQPPGSGVDWMSLIRVIKHRYADRLEILQYMLNKTENSQQTLRDVHAYTQSMLPQYLVNGVGPDNASSTSVQWASPVFQECASTHTKTVRGTLYPKLTYSERLILSSVDSTLHEICRVLVGLWADGVLKLELPEATALEPGAIVADWSSRINELTRWLDWSEWVKCRPECGFEETCYIPTWPWLHGAEWRKRPRGPPQGPGNPPEYPPQNPPENWGVHRSGDSIFKRDRKWGWVKDFTLDDDDDDYWRRPQPKCIWRVPPFDKL